MNNLLKKSSRFAKRLIRRSLVGNHISRDPNRAISRYTEVIRMDEDGQTRVLDFQNNLCDCGAIIQEKSNMLLGICACGQFVCNVCAARCSLCNSLACPHCSAQAFLSDEVFCGRCSGGIALVKRFLIGRRLK